MDEIAERGLWIVTANRHVVVIRKTYFFFNLFFTSLAENNMARLLFLCHFISEAKIKGKNEM